VVPTVPGSVNDADPSYTPGGGRIVFCSLIPSQPQDLVLVERVDGSHRHLVDYESDDAPIDPNVSPDGSTVTIALSLSGDVPPGTVGRELFRTSIDGTFQQVLLPRASFVGEEHDWAPNGRRIVFTGNADVTGEPANIATIKPDGTDLRWLTHSTDPARSFDAGSYSPDGRCIVYRLDDHGQSALMRMHPDGTNKHVILALSSLRPLGVDWGPRPTL
jgi:Tol biopolymer transport system component